jgi:hypothetical protein
VQRSTSRYPSVDFSPPKLVTLARSAYPAAEPFGPSKVSIETGKFASVRPTLWNRVRLQLGIGLLLAVLAPWAVRVRLEMQELEYIGLQNSLAGTFVALVLGYYGFRRLSRYPGVRASFHILPSFAVSYGLVLAVFFFARLDYSRLHFFVSFALATFWYYVVYFKLQRQQRLTIGVVPHGQVRNLFTIPGVDWIELSKDDPSADQYPVIAADLRADIPDEWERFLADRALNGTLVMHVKQIEESLTGRVAIEHLSENTLGSLIPGIVFAKAKRGFDFVTALIALPLLAPFLLLVAILIRLDSPGPVLFRQQRMVRNLNMRKGWPR